MIALAIASLLLVQDPLGDTSGDGTLKPPTTALYQNLRSYDITGLELLSDPTLSINMAFDSLANPLGLKNGFSFPIIELYISDDTTGSSVLLPGSGMQLPKGASWHYALKLSGDKAQLFIAEGETVLEADAPTLSKIGNTLSIKTDLPSPESSKLYSLVGSYSPFSETGWQDLSPGPSPWAFSSREQVYPVIDILSKSEAAQVRALQTGILPSVTQAALPVLPTFNPWVWVIAAGLLTALAGIVVRFVYVAPPIKPKIEGTEDLYFSPHEAAALKEIPVTEIAGAVPEMLDKLFSGDDAWLNDEDEETLATWQEEAKPRHAEGPKTEVAKTEGPKAEGPKADLNQTG